MKNCLVLLLLGAMLFAVACDKDESRKKRVFWATVTGERIAGQKAPATRTAIPEDKTNPQWLAKYTCQFHCWYDDPQYGLLPVSRGFNTNAIDDPWRQRDTIQGKLFWFGEDVITDGKIGWVFEAFDIVFVARYVPEAERYINEWFSEPNSGTWEELNPGIDPFDYEQVLDTVAYIPNRLVRETRDLSKAALDRGDTLACMKVFDETLKYYPITGAEYRELQARGEN